MKSYLRNVILMIFFLLGVSSCKKTELLNHPNINGEATLNGKTLYQYYTFEEVISNKFWYLPLGMNNTQVEEGVCYIQLFLRDQPEMDTNDFWVVLIGCIAESDFPVIGRDYEIVSNNYVELGNIYNSFYWNHSLRDFISVSSDLELCAIAGLSIPPQHEKFIPLHGTIKFLKKEINNTEYCITYNLISKDVDMGDTYKLVGKFNAKL